MYKPWFVFPFIHRWTVGLLLLWAIVDNTSMHMDVQISVRVLVFSPSGHRYILEVEFLDQMVIFMFNFLGNYRAIFYCESHRYLNTCNILSCISICY